MTRTRMAKATYEHELVTAARTIARLQRTIAQHRKAIKALAADLRRERVILRHLASRAQSVPSQVYGPGVGLKAPDSLTREPDSRPTEDITIGFEDKVFEEKK